MWSPLTSTPGNYRRSRRDNAIRKIGSAREWILVTSGGDDAGLVGKHHGLDAVSRAELDERVGHVRFDGAWGEVELPMRPRPVVRGRQTTLSAEPVAHRVKRALLGPAARGRARTAGLAVRLGVALAVARLRVRAAAPPHPLVAGLDSAGLLAGRVVEVRLDGRRERPRRAAISAIERPSASRKCRASATARRRSATRSVRVCDASPATRSDATPVDWGFRRAHQSRRADPTEFPRIQCRCRARVVSGRRARR